ncbi:Endo-1,3;1,4-beta-D-glucanase [Glycine max]|uniref:Dienelactone hydrolase domain-containing protein n=1 Tax=Glycine max TaxID=3847 RepID=A0A0R0G3K3_SOYBN|nr:Endo-1,3;1,4-beta-D-glucanase [Glycine max]
MSGPECCSNPPVLNPNARVGHVEKLAGLNSYLSSSLNSNAIPLISDIYGYEAPNLRLQLLVVPDFSHGDPYNPKNASRSIPVWLKDHGTDKGFEVAKSIIEALKSKGMMAIGAITFFGEWGDKS